MIYFALVVLDLPKEGGDLGFEVGDLVLVLRFCIFECVLELGKFGLVVMNKGSFV